MIKMLFYGLLAVLGASLLAAPSNAQNAGIIKAASPTTPVAAAAIDFSVVAGKTCRGYYKQSEGGTGYLERPESAFKTTSIGKDGAFTLLAIKAAPGASDGWDKATGNNYWKQGDVKFQVQPDGSWFFANPAASSRYYMTYVGVADGAVMFTVRYEHGTGSSVGKAACTAR